jgi:hypothetical protein
VYAQLVEAVTRWRSDLTPMPDEIRISQQQWAEMWNAVMPPAEPPEVGERGAVFGIPAVIVEHDEDSTLYQERSIRVLEKRLR